MGLFLMMGSAKMATLCYPSTDSRNAGSLFSSCLQGKISSTTGNVFSRHYRLRSLFPFLTLSINSSSAHLTVTCFPDAIGNKAGSLFGICPSRKSLITWLLKAFQEPPAEKPSPMYGSFFQAESAHIVVKCFL